MNILHRVLGTRLVALTLTGSIVAILAGCGGGGGGGGSAPPESGTPPPVADDGMIPLSAYTSVENFIDYLASWPQSNTTEPLAVTGTPPVSDTTEPVAIPGP